MNAPKGTRSPGTRTAKSLKAVVTGVLCSARMDLFTDGERAQTDLFLLAFLFLVVRHLLLVAMHLFLLASCYY